MLSFRRTSIRLRGRWPPLLLMYLGACAPRSLPLVLKPPVEPEATPARLVALAPDERSSDLVDLGEMEDDREFGRLSQNVREAAKICRGAWQATRMLGCTPSRVTESMGNLLQAANLLAEQPSTKAKSTASQIAELIDGGATCPEAEEIALTIAGLVDILAADFAQVRIAKLDIFSEPRGADVRISTLYGSSAPKALRTNGSFVNIPRGRWRYYVERGDMKPAVGVLDLIDDPRPQLTCFLENDASQVESSCRRGE